MRMRRPDLVGGEAWTFIPRTDDRNSRILQLDTLHGYERHRWIAVLISAKVCLGRLRVGERRRGWVHAVR